MSLTNSSALSCIATAVGCTLTGIAVNEQLDQPSPVASPIKLGVQQNQTMDADELMAAAEAGVEQSVAPPGQIFTSELTQTPEVEGFSNIEDSNLEIWQQSPLDIGNIVAAARQLPRESQAGVDRSIVEPNRQFFPNYLNFDADGDAPQPIEEVAQTTPEPELLSAMASTFEDLPVLEPIPTPPPPMNEQAIASEYIVEPQALSATGWGPVDFDDAVEYTETEPPTNAAQYIVEPEAVMEIPPASVQVEEHVYTEMATQYIVEPEAVIAAATSVESNRYNYSEIDVPAVQPYSAPIPPVPPTPSVEPLPQQQPEQMPRLLRTLREPYDPSAELTQKIEPTRSTTVADSHSSAYETALSVNRVPPPSPTSVSVEPIEDSSTLAYVEEEADPDTEQMPSLLRNLVESYNPPADVMYDIKTDQSAGEQVASKFANP